LDAFKATFESGAPPYNAPREAIETMHYHGFGDLGSPGARSKVGDVAPAFELINQDGELVRSVDLLSRGPLMITFFRGHW